MKKADYSKIAAFYDDGRTLSEQNMGLWLGLIAKHAGAPPSARTLDLGCGTGRFSLSMASRLKWRVIGVDSSVDMLAKARAKDAGGLVAWHCQTAEALALAGGLLDVVFMSHLLHHVDSPARVVEECWRVLDWDGVVLIRYGAIEQIRDDVEHTLFPQALAIDQARGHTLGTVEGWLHGAGFVDVGSEEVVQKTYDSGQAHLDAAMAKSTSVLTMISEEAFGTGIRELRKYVALSPRDPWLLFDRMTLTVGRKCEAV